MVKRFEVYLVNLDEQPSPDPKNTRPAVIVSPDELNRHVETVIIAPLSATRTRYPTRLPIEFLNETRYLILDQIQTIDNQRLVKKIGELEAGTRAKAIALMLELFS